jgi:hypothetical protein
MLFVVEVFKAPIFYKLFIYSKNCSFDLNRYNVMNVAQATIKVLYILTESYLISTIDVKINKIGKYTENREIW